MVGFAGVVGAVDLQGGERVRVRWQAGRGKDTTRGVNKASCKRGRGEEGREWVKGDVMSGISNADAEKIKDAKGGAQQQRHENKRDKAGENSTRQQQCQQQHQTGKQTHHHRSIKRNKTTDRNTDDDGHGKCVWEERMQRVQQAAQRAQLTRW